MASRSSCTVFAHHPAVAPPGKILSGKYEQPVALLDGDRFWYEVYLTDDGGELVSGTTLADVIRSNKNIGSELQNSELNRRSHLRLDAYDLHSTQALLNVPATPGA